ncbi:hypothetical protein MLD38_033222 [Melastoma candidum]|uniref:Uncharacterized protein n=1 Tax=Melastoma candidum TaxID=119954 RepID=A0ACB9M676_9MYRT|nr:hypothetical protein MLD38_033222 [Melastoma candidum]
MGKGLDEEEALPSTVVSIGSEQGLEGRSRSRRRRICGFFCCCCGGCGGDGITRHLGLKCALVLLLSAGVFLSAIFWLPPFSRLADRQDLDLDPRYRGHEIVASFNVEKSVAFLEENIVQLHDDILWEIGGAMIKVSMLSVEQVNGSNAAKVVFAIDSDAKKTKISTAVLSLIRESFESFVTQQVTLRLTTSLFGNASSFEVLKFAGGITIIPPQSAFLLQKVQILFNFTLNYPIEQIQANFADLTTQLKSGLRLTSYENLYISLSNSRGSTVAPPTIVQSSVLLTVGNTPSMPRLKQLAQTITGSHSGNLGLNNTIFGRVKQVQLSSILQHSLNGTDQGGAPAPSPMPQLQHPRHHHHQSHDHRHSPVAAPTISPSPAIYRGLAPRHRGSVSSSHHHSRSPAPAPGHKAKPPGCRYGYKGGSSKGGKKEPPVPPAPAPSLRHHSPISSPARLPSHSRHPAPAPSPHRVHARTPLPHVSLTHARPPSSSEPAVHYHGLTPAFSPSPESSSSGRIKVALGAVLFALISLRL